MSCLERGVLISGVEKYTNMVLGEEESVLFREVSSFQGCPYSLIEFTACWLTCKLLGLLERASQQRVHGIYPVGELSISGLK